MKQFKKINELLKLMYKVSPSFIFLTIFGSLFSTSQILVNVILPKYLIDELVIQKDIQKAFLIGGVIIIFNFLISIINKTYTRFLSVKQSYVSKKITEEMSLKIMNIEYRYLEDPYYLDLKERAVFSINNQSALTRLVSSISSITTNIFTLIGLLAIMLSLGYVLMLIVVVGVIITLVINCLFMKYQMHFFQNIIPINRRYSYYFNLTFNEQIAKDMRLYNMSPLVLDKIQHYNKINLDYFKSYFRKQGAVLGLQGSLTAVQTGLVYLYVSNLVKTKAFSLGSFTMFANSAINFSKTFDSFFFNIIDMMQILDFLDPVVEFMLLPDAINLPSDNILTEINNIEFKNVSFTYPKTTEQILNDVSFKINAGQKISIVGLNGAGKTTIIKLLCRFYKPDSGEILINGQNIYSYDYNSYLKAIAIVFQDYKLLAYSIMKNITGTDNSDEEEISKIISKVGLTERINELPKGLHTRLNKAFDQDGIELSGGQSQKVAIARALYKDASLVILDEPTSALDPLAEAEIYEHFNDLVTNKTAIYISHRMSSSVFCDYILVLDDGKVVGFDSHANLMKQEDSLYYKLFTTQSENYLLSK